jgi:hypothetical protein
MQDSCSSLPGPCGPSCSDIAPGGASQTSRVLESQQSGLGSTSSLLHSMSSTCGAAQDQDASRLCSLPDPLQQSNKRPRSEMRLTAASNLLLGALPQLNTMLHDMPEKLAHLSRHGHKSVWLQVRESCSSMWRLPVLNFIQRVVGTKPAVVYLTVMPRILSWLSNRLAVV